MNVEAILNRKGREVIKISADATLQQLAERLHEHRIGAVVVADASGEMVGIISERDVVRAIATSGPAALKLAVHAAMTTHVTSCDASDSLEEIMTVMTRKRIRHLPVTHQGRIVGIVSIGDVVKQRLDEQDQEIGMWRELFTPR